MQLGNENESAAEKKQGHRLGAQKKNEIAAKIVINFRFLNQQGVPFFSGFVVPLQRISSRGFYVFLRTQVWNEALWDVTKGAYTASLQGLYERGSWS